MRRSRSIVRAHAIFALCTVCVVLLLLLTRNAVRVRARGRHNVVLLCASSSDDEGYKRWFASGALWGARGEPLGRERPWGGHGTKLNLLRERLEDMLAAGRHDDIVLYTDSHDVLFAGPVRAAVARFVSSGARVLFAAETSLRPTHDQRTRFHHAPGQYPYLNAGALIGYASSLHALVSLGREPDAGDDQRYYTDVYLNESLRAALRVRLDHRAEIFQCLIDATDHVRLETSENEWPRVRNVVTGTSPLLLHGNGPYKEALWALEGSLVHAWVARPDLAPRDVRPQVVAALARLYGLASEDDATGHTHA